MPHPYVKTKTFLLRTKTKLSWTKKKLSAARKSFPIVFESKHGQIGYGQFFKDKNIFVLDSFDFVQEKNNFV